VSVIEVTREQAIATLTLNRPDKRNALRGEDFAALARALDELGADPEVRVVILTGASGAFCAGADLKSLADATASPLARIHQGHVAARALAHFPKPTIAAINGVAVGAGLNLALACDLAVAGQSAMASEIFIERGLTLDYGGSALLVQRVGLHRAKELAFFANRLVGAELLEWGLVNKVVADDEVLGAARTWAEDLATRSPTALALTKRLLDAAASSLAQAVESEVIAQVAALSDPSISETLLNF